MTELVCIFCQAVLDGPGNNPEPLAAPPRRCCDECNISLVIPARLWIAAREPGQRTLFDLEAGVEYTEEDIE